MSSKFKNYTNHKISAGSRKTSFLGKPAAEVGPGSYTITVSDIKPSGRYVLSNNESSKSRVFSKSERKGLVYRHMLSNPGPGQ